MNAYTRIWNITRRVLQSHAGAEARRRLWNAEFKHGRWAFLEETDDADCVYPVIEAYLNHGSILDLGCGSGSTAKYLAGRSQTYVGVDISDVALALARGISPERVHAGRQRFVRHDIESYVPDQKFDVILFRDSIYYIPLARVVENISRYRNYLNDRGAVVLRIADGDKRYSRLVQVIESAFLLEKKLVFEKPRALILVVGSKSSSSAS